VALRCDESERNADERREEHRADGELDRGGEAVLDLLRDRAARSDARPEVAGADGLQVPPVLLVEGLVETVLVADLGDRLVRRPLAEQRLGRRARQRPDPEEDEERQPDQYRDEQEEPADGEAEQCAPTSSSAGLPSFESLFPPTYPTNRTVANDSSDTGLGL
jgi:hypothetical protein